MRKREAKAKEERERKRDARKAARRRAAGEIVAPATPAVADDHNLSAEEQARLAHDKAAALHRAQAAAARGYVAAYRRRGLLRPPDACEWCGIGERLTPWGEPMPLIPWHPDPAKPREVAWLCAPCRTHVRATREPLTLTWVWPGGLPARPRGRPRTQALPAEDASAWCAAAVAAGEAAAARATLPGLAAELFLHTFLAAVGPERVEALYAEGVRAGAAWAPLGDSRRDVLRAWVECERMERSTEERSVEPVPAWERRPRRDRLPSPPPPEKESAPVMPLEPAERNARMERAIAKLEMGEAAVDAMLERVTAALERLHPRSHRAADECSDTS